MVNGIMASEPIDNALALLHQRVAELEQALVEREHAEKAMRSESEERLNSILESLEDIVWSQSPTTGEVLFLNPAAESIYGRPAADFFADSDLWMQVLHPDDAGLAERFFTTILSAGWAEVEYRIVRQDGEVRWLHDRGRLIRDATGAPIRVDGIATDNTERKRAEAAREQQRRQEELIGMQEAMLCELSTPLIPISDKVMVMPLIGTVDSRRAQQVMETLLHGIASIVPRWRSSILPAWPWSTRM